MCVFFTLNRSFYPSTCKQEELPSGPRKNRDWRHFFSAYNQTYFLSFSIECAAITDDTAVPVSKTCQLFCTRRYLRRSYKKFYRRMVSILILSLYGPQSRFGDNWRQITWSLSGLSPKRDSGSEGSSGVFFSVVVVVDCVKRCAFHTRCWILKQSFVPTSNNLQSQESLRSSCRNPFRTAVPFWGQNTQFPSELLPKRDCGPKGVHSIDAVRIDPLITAAGHLMWLMGKFDPSGSTPVHK